MPPADSWRSLYPFESHSIDLDGHRYHYLDEGSGDVLLLVHGNPTWSFHWRALIERLSPAFRLVAVDHIGCGLSDQPRGYPYRLAQHIENLTAFVRRLELDNVTLVAQDWGGAIGLGAALADAQRYRRFVMLNTAAFRSRQMPWRIRLCRMPVLGRLAVQGLNGFARAALRMAVSHPKRITAAARDGILAPYDSWAHREAIYRFVDDIPMAARHPSYATLRGVEEGLPSLAEHPWLFVWGMQDWCFTPAFLDRFLEFLPQAEVRRLPDAGHWVLEDAPEQVGAAVESFLARHPLAVASRPV